MKQPTSIRKLNPLLLLQVSILIFETIALIKGAWGGDFWEHAAIVKQFSHSLIETHPILNITQPHAFYSPYLFVLGFIVKYTGLSVIKTLTIAGFVNLVLFLHIFPKFVMSIFNNKDIAFYSLLFTLLFWFYPYSFSGFLSINVLHFVLPYPSTFAIVLLLWLFVYYQKTVAPIKYLVSILISSIVIITHPLTGIVLCFSLCSIHLNQDGFRITKNWMAFGSAMVITFILVFLWPYYSFADLVGGASDVFHAANKKMYLNPILATFPAILALPVIAYQRGKQKNRTFIYLITFLLSCYLLGFIFDKWSFGRLISFIVIICHIYLADLFVRVKQNQKDNKRISHLLNASMGLVVLFFAIKNIRTEYFITTKGWMVSENMYKNISELLSEEDIVFSTIEESAPLPAFGPKVISCFHPIAFVDDCNLRNQNTNLFFNSDSLSDNQRQEMIVQYQANKILITRSTELNVGLKTWLNNNAIESFRDQNFVLFDVVAPAK